MKSYDLIMDELLKQKRPKFSERFGNVNLLEEATCGDFNNLSSILNNKQSNLKINFLDENFFNDCGTNIRMEPATSYKSFVCNYQGCCKTFTSLYGLKYHIDHGHTLKKAVERKPFVCKIHNCGKKYKNNNGLKYHMNHSHKDSL